MFKCITVQFASVLLGNLFFQFLFGFVVSILRRWIKLTNSIYLSYLQRCLFASHIRRFFCMHNICVHHFQQEEMMPNLAKIMAYQIFWMVTITQIYYTAHNGIKHKKVYGLYLCYVSFLHYSPLNYRHLYKCRHVNCSAIDNLVICLLINAIIAGIACSRRQPGCRNSDAWKSS